MTGIGPPSSLLTDRHNGVYFQRRDYGGFFRRGACGAIDVVALLILWVAVGFGWFLAGPDVHVNEWEIMPIWLPLSYLYLAPLKGSRLRTIGYRLMGLKVVDLQGRRPGWPRMTIRFATLLFGSEVWIFDLFWLCGQTDRRKISDLFAGTYVVRVNAEPEGRGPVGLAFYGIQSYFFVFREVFRPTDARPA